MRDRRLAVDLVVVDVQGVNVVFVDDYFGIDPYYDYGGAVDFDLVGCEADVETERMYSLRVDLRCSLFGLRVSGHPNHTRTRRGRSPLFLSPPLTFAVFPPGPILPLPLPPISPSLH